MSGHILREERAYARGVVLGISLAEIVTLLLFVLLLLFAALAWHEQRQRATLQAELDRSRSAEARLREFLAAAGGSSDRFDDLFQKLRLAEDRASAAEAARAGLEEASRRLEQEKEALAREVQHLRAEADEREARQRVTEAVLEQLAGRPLDEGARQVMAQRLATAVAVEKLVGGTKPGTPEDATGFVEALTKVAADGSPTPVTDPISSKTLRQLRRRRGG